MTCTLFLHRKQKTPSQKQWRILSQGSDSPLDLVGTEASGTSVHMARSTIDNRLNALDIGLPGTIGTSVGVGDLDTESHALATVITLRHFVAPPIGQNSLILFFTNART